jgi:arginase family enzyme
VDVVEVCPPYDPDGITVLVAATVLFDFIASAGSRREDAP